MPSKALAALLQGLEEVRDLQRANPTPIGKLPKIPRVVRAINRSSVVLMYSHLERYLRALNEAATEVVNGSQVSGDQLPERLRLRHSRSRIDELSRTQWDNRSVNLRQFAEEEGWLWSSYAKAALDHVRLVDWMKSVSPKKVLRLFELWGIENIFQRITRAEHTRQFMCLKIQELADKRHDIAHGHYSTEATRLDIREYGEVVDRFCTRADAAMSRNLARMLAVTKPW